MNCSILLNQILARAEEIRSEAETQAVSAPCLIIAVLELCLADYRGITPLDPYTAPECFEEERVRYLCRKFFKHSGTLTCNLIRHRLKKDYLPYDTDFLTANANLLEAEMQRRNKHLLSADLAFMAAFRSMKPEHRAGIRPEYKEEFDLAACMEDIDRNIYDYVIAEIGKLQQKLQEKADQAKAKRDWRPAAKCMEPEQLEAAFFDAIQTQSDGNDLLVQIPHFFGNEETLELRFRFFDGCYFVHDCGCALKQLRKFAKNEAHFQAVYDKISKNLSIEDGKMVGTFSQSYHFFHYLQMLVFAAHGDLYWEQLDEPGLNYDPYRRFPAQSEPLEPHTLCDMLRDQLDFGYDENTGLWLSVQTHYSLNSSGVSYRIETLPGGIRISDNRIGKLEGEVLESFYWDHDDLSQYRAFITPYLNRFGGVLEGKDPAITAPAEELLPALFRFFNLAVLFSELGRLIDLPEVAE